MLEIRSISVTSAEGKSRLSSDIIQNGESHPLWFEVDDKYGKYLCAERSDAFVIGLLHYLEYPQFLTPKNNERPCFIG